MNREEFDEVIWGDHPDYEDVTDTEIYDQSRWSVYKSRVVREEKTGKYFNIWWGEGATEYQDGQDEPCGMYEVEPVEVTVVTYKPKKEGQKIEF